MGSASVFLLQASRSILSSQSGAVATRAVTTTPVNGRRAGRRFRGQRTVSAEAPRRSTVHRCSSCTKPVQTRLASSLMTIVGSSTTTLASSSWVIRSRVRRSNSWISATLTPLLLGVQQVGVATEADHRTMAEIAEKVKEFFISKGYRIYGLQS